MWAPFRRQEQVWLLVTWINGRRERIEEDYEPWTYVADLLDGHFKWESGTNEVVFHAEWLSGPDRDDAWEKYGILEAVGAYMAPPDET
jgi:hypothetical protein